MEFGEVLATDNITTHNLGNTGGCLLLEGFCNNPTGTIDWNGS